MSELNERQLSNLEAVIEAALEFSNDAGIGFSEPSLDKETIVIESGHQPNFIPHAGLFKKVFLLDVFRKRANDKGKKSIVLFGFPDYNLCTAKLLSQNKLPAFNKIGYEKFGFRIAWEGIWKRFNYPAKPTRSQWENTLGKIASHYKRYPISPETGLRLSQVIETLDECYKKAKNFPDLNAFFIANICSKLDMNACFFRYSDIQKKGVFIEQWEDIILNLDQYNSVYNNSIERHRLDIPICAPDSLPFWYHCQCGSKVALQFSQGYATGICKSCAAKHEINLDRLEEVFRDMSPNAVARNITFSEGMGTRIFISGTGGGLLYGRISDDISEHLGFNLPVTVSWKSRDYYTGTVHEAAMTALARILGVKKEALLAVDIKKIINDKETELGKRSAEARERRDKAEINKYEGERRNIRTSMDIMKAIFTVTPSFIDLLISQGTGKVRGCWAEALKEVGEEPVIIKDVIYRAESLDIYKKVQEII